LVVLNQTIDIILTAKRECKGVKMSTGKLEINTYNSEKQNKFFYAIMGEHFASLEHKKELDGYQIYNTPTSFWFVLFEIDEDSKRNTIIGFCSLIKKKNYSLLDNFIILKQFRNQKHSKTLLNYVLDFAQNHKVTVKAIIKNQYMKKNFEKLKIKKLYDKGTYSVYQREPS